MIIALTDGEDNQSSATPTSIITKAKDHGIVVHTIALGSTSTSNLQAIADGTGGICLVLTASNIATFYTSIAQGSTTGSSLVVSTSGLTLTNASGGTEIVPVDLLYTVQ